MFRNCNQRWIIKPFATVKPVLDTIECPHPLPIFIVNLILTGYGSMLTGPHFVMTCCDSYIAEKCVSVEQAVSNWIMNSNKYTPYDRLNLGNQKNRKLEVFSRKNWKLEERHLPPPPPPNTQTYIIDILIHIREQCCPTYAIFIKIRVIG